jgi:hydrogenase maturation protease
LSVGERAVLVVGVGNDLRGDDGAGPEVARRLARRPGAGPIRVAEQPADPTRLLELWRGVDAVVLVDTMHTDQDPGTICRLDASAEPLPARLRTSSSSHAFGLNDAVELGRVLGELPARVIVYAIEGRSFQTGAALSAQLEDGLPALAEAVWGEATALAAGLPPG